MLWNIVGIDTVLGDIVCIDTVSRNIVHKI
jgi:hypothetical protein